MRMTTPHRSKTTDQCHQYDNAPPWESLGRGLSSLSRRIESPPCNIRDTPDILVHRKWDEAVLWTSTRRVTFCRECSRKYPEVSISAQKYLFVDVWCHIKTVESRAPWAIHRTSARPERQSQSRQSPRTVELNTQRRPKYASQFRPRLTDKTPGWTLGARQLFIYSEVPHAEHKLGLQPTREGEFHELTRQRRLQCLQDQC
jgi:hypothetical protein